MTTAAAMPTAPAAPVRSRPTLHPDTLANAVPEVIHHHHDPRSPHRIRPLWVRAKPDGSYRLQLSQPLGNLRFHDDGSPCFRPEVCPKGSRPALAHAVQWLIEKEN